MTEIILPHEDLTLDHLSVSEARQKYPDNRILLAATAYDIALRIPSHGRVAALGSFEEICQARLGFPYRENAHYDFLDNGYHTSKGEEKRQFILRIEQGLEEPPARWVKWNDGV